MADQSGNIPPARTEIHCAFCGKTPDQVNAMISGPNGIYICDECISLSAEAMMTDLNMRGLESDALNQVLQVTAEEESEDAKAEEFTLSDLPTPRQLLSSFQSTSLVRRKQKKHWRLRYTTTINASA